MRRIVTLTRPQLLTLLSARTTDASIACMAAVRDGAPYKVHTGTVTRDSALRIYAFRAQTIRLDGADGIGIEEAIKDLAASDYLNLRIGAVSSDRDYTLFMDPECHELIACLGVG